MKRTAQALDDHRKVLHRDFLQLLGRRIYMCRNALQISHGRAVSQERFGKLIEEMFIPETSVSAQPIPSGGFSKVNVSRWERGKAAPSLSVILAIGELVGADPGWIAFGSASGARQPGWSLATRAEM